MNHFCFLLIAIVLSLTTTSVSGMGFTNIFGHVNGKTEEEASLVKHLAEDSWSSRRLATFPRLNSKSKFQQVASKQGRHQHVGRPNIDGLAIAFTSHDEEIIERLVELQE